jgi:predicted AAA+ superfamily ATPase
MVQEKIAAINALDLQRIAFLVCRGGWPRATFMEDDVALEQAYDYYDAIVNQDISRVDGVKRNIERVKTLMRSYARNQGAQISNAMLKADMKANDVDSLDEDTVMSYVNALKKYLLLKICLHGIQIFVLKQLFVPLIRDTTLILLLRLQHWGLDQMIC